jgi:hypothetical protein
MATKSRCFPGSKSPATGRRHKVSVIGPAPCRSHEQTCPDSLPAELFDAPVPSREHESPSAGPFCRKAKPEVRLFSGPIRCGAIIALYKLIARSVAAECRSADGTNCISNAVRGLDRAALEPNSTALTCPRKRGTRHLDNEPASTGTMPTLAWACWTGRGGTADQST